MTTRLSQVVTDISASASLLQPTAEEIPMIMLARFRVVNRPTWTYAPIDRPAHDFVVDANYYKENVLGGDHEFKFGFEYKTSKFPLTASMETGCT